MTPEEKQRIEKIEEREKKATTGPWQYCEWDEYRTSDPDCMTTEMYCGVRTPAQLKHIKEPDIYTTFTNDFVENAEFIASARQDIPFLLDLVKRQDVAIKDAEELMKAINYHASPGTRSAGEWLQKWGSK